MTEVQSRTATPPPPGCAVRRGSGAVLGIVAMMVAILLLLAISQAFFSDVVLDDAAAEQLGATALTLAESALEELQLQVRSGVNDSRSPLNKLFRKPLVRSPEEGFELPLRTVPGAQRLATQAPYAQAGLSVSVEPPRVAFRQVFELGKYNYNEHFGVISYRVRAFSTRARPRVERWLTATQEYKVVAASIPPPFNQVCLFIVNAEPMSGGVEANRAMDVFANVRRNWMDYLGTLIQNASGAAQEIGTVRARFEKIPQLEPPTFRATPPPGMVHLLPEDLTAFIDPAFSAKTPEVPLKVVDLGTQVPRWRQEIEKLDREANEKVNALIQAGKAPGGKKPTVEMVQEAVAAMQTVATQTYLYQDAIRQWQDMMGERSGNSRKDLLTDVEHLSAKTLKRKAFFTVKEGDAGGDINAALDKLRERLRSNTGTETINGIVWLENERSVLDLTRLPPVKGRVVFAVSGDVRVGNLGRATDADFVAVVCRGTTTIAGDVVGGLAAMGGLKIEGSPKVTGVLVVDAPRPGTLANLSVVFDPRLRMGALQKDGTFKYEDTFLYVGVAPVLTGRSVSRSKPNP